AAVVVRLARSPAYEPGLGSLRGSYGAAVGAVALTDHHEGETSGARAHDSERGAPGTAARRGRDRRRAGGASRRHPGDRIDRRHRRIAARPRDTEPDDRHRSERVAVRPIPVLPIAEPAE